MQQKHFYMYIKMCPSFFLSEQMITPHLGLRSNAEKEAPSLRECHVATKHRYNEEHAKIMHSSWTYARFAKSKKKFTF